MTRNSRFRSLAAALGAMFVAAACGGGGGGGTSETLASDQTLSFPMVDDIGDLDPAHMSAAVDIDIFHNVFSGLYKFTDDLKQVPDIASGPPTISSDGLTYTFKMRQDAKFSNGDAVKAADFVYSWNRAARIQGDYASVFAPVAGYDEVAAGKAKEMTRLKAPDGYANGAITPEDLIRYNNDPKLKAELTLKPIARTDWIGFNLKTGPFAGIDAGLHGRHAFSTAIDRAQLVDIACSKGTACNAATGGVITKGLQGYLGDNTDPNSKFDAAAAKAEYKAWDPDGSKVKGLVYTYNSNAFNKAVCENLASQWQQNLGVSVQCTAQDRAWFSAARTRCTYPIFRHSWGADYDNPQDWFDFLFVTGAGSGGTCYSNPTLDNLVKSANKKSLADGLAEYKQANKILVDQSIPGPLVYYIHANVVHPWVKGVDGNALYDFFWSDARILQHS